MSWRRSCLKPLKPELYEMCLYVNLKVQANCHVKLRQDKVTHFYSVPYIHVGKQVCVAFTRSCVKVYVEYELVASHIRSYTYGYATVMEHLASNSRVIMERLAAYYVEKAKDISPGDDSAESVPSYRLIRYCYDAANGTIFRLL